MFERGDETLPRSSAGIVHAIVTEYGSVPEPWMSAWMRPASMVMVTV